MSAVPHMAASRIPVAVCAAVSRSGYAFWSTKPSASTDCRPASRSSHVPSTSCSIRVDAGEPEVVAAGPDAHLFVELLVEEHLLAGRTLRPEIRRVDVPLRPEGRELDGRHQASPRPTARTARAIGVSGRVRHQATNAAPASDSAAEVSAADQQRSAIGAFVERPVEQEVRARVEGIAGPAGARTGRLAAGGFPGHASTPRSRPGSVPPAPRTGTTGGRGVACEPVRREAHLRLESACDRLAERRSRRSAEPEGQQRLQVPIGDECLDLTAVPPTGGHRRSPSRSRAIVRSARWIRTRTAPSERPRTPAISAVDISSTKAARRAPSVAGQPRHGLPGGARLLAPDDLGGRVGRARNSGRGLERLLRSPEAGALAVGDDVAGNAEEPDAERRGATTVLGPRSPRTGGGS